MSENQAISNTAPEKPAHVPLIGFVSLGCPKALVDSEQILTQLRAEGYGVSPSYAGADLVVVNTCGFIDSAVQESLDAIGEALAENGRVIVTDVNPLSPAVHLADRWYEVPLASDPGYIDTVLSICRTERAATPRRPKAVV